MNYTKTDFKDLYVIDSHPHYDNRGFFIETFRKKDLEKIVGYDINFCQDNRVKSTALVLRGLHFQTPPYSQSKLISVSNGEILDVVVDTRKNSETFGKYFSINLSSKNKKILFIPKGFAHGYLSLTDDTIVDYKVDNYFNESSQSGIYFNDPSLNIDWKLDKQNFIISEKDINLSNFKW